MEQEVKNYANSKLAKNEQKYDALRRRNNYIDTLLSGRNAAAKIDFAAAEEQIIPILNRCNSIDEIFDVCQEAFSSIKGIGERTISDYAFHAAFIRDIDPEANCVCFLSRKAKQALSLAGIIDGNTIRLGDLSELFRNYSKMSFIDFANKHYRCFLAR